MEFAGVGKVTRQGQVTLPCDARRELGLQIGENVEFFSSGNLILIRKQPEAVEIFDALAKEVSERFEKRGIKRSEVAKAIRQYRAERHGKTKTCV